MQDYSEIKNVKQLDFKPVYQCLKDYAFNPVDTKGRRDKNDDDTLFYSSADPFLIDYTKILESKSFRRLQDKTQVFDTSLNTYVRNRLTHTNEVISYSIKMSQILGLNTNLCMAIAAGHDIGHTFFGHVVSEMLDKILESEGREFKHETNSVTIAQYIERKGKGLNLSFETLEGILNHSRGKRELDINSKLPLEYAVVMLADKFYVFSDYNDSLRAGFIDNSPKFNELKKLMNSLGNNQRERANNCIKAICYESMDEGTVSFSKGEVFNAFDVIKYQMYKKIYEKINRKALIWQAKQVYKAFDKATLDDIVEACKQTGNSECLKDKKYKPLIKPHPALMTSLLTDMEVKSLIPKLTDKRKANITIKDIIETTSLGEIIPYMLHNKFDPFVPNLEWAK